MDTEKLLRILKDIQNDERDLKIKEKIDAVRNSVAQNNNDGFSNAKNQVTELVNELKETSIVYGHSRTEILLLSKLKGETYFGSGLANTLENLFKSASFELLVRLDEYRNKRNEFAQKVDQLINTLEGIGVSEYRPDSYEVGVVLPSDEGDLDKLTKRVKEFKFLLESLSETATGSRQSVKVTRLSNGTLEIFSLQPVEVATLLSTLLLNVSMIWDKITNLQKEKRGVEKSSYGDETKKKIKEALDGEAERIKNEILNTLPDQVVEKANKKIDAGRKNEIKNQIRTSVKAVFGWFEVGIELDITPIRVSGGDANNPGNDPATVKQVENTNERLRTIYNLPQEIKKLPFRLQNTEEEEEVLEEKPKEDAEIKKEKETPKKESEQKETPKEKGKQ